MLTVTHDLLALKGGMRPDPPRASSVWAPGLRLETERKTKFTGFAMNFTG